jgi:uncharacterized protein (TIGR02599 family)
VELLVASAVVLIIAVLMSSVIDRTSSLWKKTRDQSQSFQDARASLESLGFSVRQAVLNPSIEYFQGGQPRQTGDPNFIPDAFGRYSDLLFFVTNNASGLDPGARSHAVFFQAPLAYSTNASNEVLPRLLNMAGYYVAYGSDLNFIPGIPALNGQAKNRYRLMQYLQPSESFDVYTSTNSSGRVDTGIVMARTAADLSRNSRILADNVIALIVQPKTSAADTNGISPTFSYDSRAGGLTNTTRHQLPPMIGITLIAIDEQSASRLEAQGTLQTTIDGALSQKFLVTTNFEADLKGVQDVLTTNGISHRVFTTDIGIRSARWSEQ